MFIKIGTNFCKCPACGEYFTSDYPFRMHRTGPYTGRKCLSKEEMETKGMEFNRKGYWMSRKREMSILSPDHPPRTDDLPKDGV
jgi:hypothetical protein